KHRFWEIPGMVLFLIHRKQFPMNQKTLRGKHTRAKGKVSQERPRSVQEFRKRNSKKCVKRLEPIGFVSPAGSVVPSAPNGRRVVHRTTATQKAHYKA
ncbi:MAG: hypothetical protein PUH29_00050, partial [Lachnospiraceae bacterium]|nr:hypothetical protein [Lachnospiraceae bacterium]